MRPTVLQIPQPCHESWDAMTPATAGRHCAACQKTVVDFTLKTDAEILAYLAKAAGGRTCGRFVAGQLERPLQRAASAAPTVRWRAWLAAAVALWSVREVVGNDARAQAPVQMLRRIDKTIPEQLQATRLPEHDEPVGVQVLRGEVQDSATREGLPGVSVLIKNSTTGVATSADGKFELRVPDELIQAGQVILQVRYVGYVLEERIMMANSAQPTTFLLQSDVKGMLGELVVVGGIEMKKPWPWHPRRLYYWTKYQLTRPFRRS
jgi:hypothetical protein